MWEAVVLLGGRRDHAGSEIELVGEVHARLSVCATLRLLERRDLLDHRACGVGRVERGVVARLMLGEPERHDADREDFVVGKQMRERVVENRAVVCAGYQHDLRVDGDARVEQLHEHLTAARGVAPDERTAHVLIPRVDRDVQRREVLLDDAVDVLVGEVRERDEVPLQKREAVVVVAEVERRTHVLGEHRHEAEGAGVLADVDLVEEDVCEVDTPAFREVALEHDVARVSLGVDDLQLDHVLVGEPLPVDDIEQLDPVGRDDHVAGNESAALGGTPLLDVRDDPSATSGGATRRVVGRGAVHHIASSFSMTPWICTSGVDAPAETPTVSTPSNHSGSSSSAVSTW